MRTDIHRPSAINPEDYEFVDCIYVGCKELDIGEVFANKEARDHINAHMARTGGRYSGHEHGGTCHICGAFALYLAVWYHPASNRYIQTGEDCAAKLDMGQPEAFNGLRRAIYNARAANAGKMKARAMLGDLGLDRAWELYVMEDCVELVRAGAVLDRIPDWDSLPEEDKEVRTRYTNSREYNTLCDIVSRIVQYGNVSDKQAAFLRSLCDRMARRPEIEAERKAEHDAAAPCPTGRQVIEGEVLKTEERDTVYGPTWKMLVKTPAGWLCWGTIPSGIGELSRGDHVRLTATITPSDRDPKFGFFSRPSKAQKLCPAC